MLNSVGKSKHPRLTLTVVWNQSPVLPLKSTVLCHKVLDDGDEVGTNHVFVYGGPKCCVPDPVDSLFEVYADMVKILMLLIFFQQYSQIEDSFCSTSSHTEARLFLSDDLFCLGFEPVQ